MNEKHFKMVERIISKQISNQLVNREVGSNPNFQAGYLNYNLLD